jgi:hypothetical protein
MAFGKAAMIMLDICPSVSQRIVQLQEGGEVIALMKHA